MPSQHIDTDVASVRTTSSFSSRVSLLRSDLKSKLKSKPKESKESKESKRLAKAQAARKPPPQTAKINGERRTGTPLNGTCEPARV